MSQFRTDALIIPILISGHTVLIRSSTIIFGNTSKILVSVFYLLFFKTFTYMAPVISLVRFRHIGCNVLNHCKMGISPFRHAML